jgi:hypothetical protein
MKKTLIALTALSFIAVPGLASAESCQAAVNQFVKEMAGGTPGQIAQDFGVSASEVAHARNGFRATVCQ